MLRRNTDLKVYIREQATRPLVQTPHPTLPRWQEQRNHIRSPLSADFFSGLLELEVLENGWSTFRKSGMSLGSGGALGSCARVPVPMPCCKLRIPSSMDVALSQNVEMCSCATLLWPLIASASSRSFPAISSAPRMISKSALLISSAAASPI